MLYMVTWNEHHNALIEAETAIEAKWIVDNSSCDEMHDLVGYPDDTVSDVTDIEAEPSPERH